MPFDAVATPDRLRHVEKPLPAEWFEAAATGDADRCARRVVDQFGAGADGVILHGVTPAEAEPVVEAYRKVRPARAAVLPRNPGRG